jgi:uncharacterized protein YciI
VITAFDWPGALELRLQVRPAHLDYLNGKMAQIKVGGLCSIRTISRSAVC